MVICTVTSANNLHRAKLMAKSIKTYHPHAKVIVCLLEESIHESAHSRYFDGLILAKNIGVKHFYSFLFKYNVYEASCAVKAFILRYVMNQYVDESHFVYLDTDMKVYYWLNDLINKLNDHAIVITPQQMEMSAYSVKHIYYGQYNAGIVAITRSDEARRFLDWWADRVYHYCFFDSSFFLDQRWLSIVPSLFEAYIFRHPGYNVAAWNLSEANRVITHVSNGTYFLGNTPLCLFHFSGLNDILPWCIQSAYPDRQNGIQQMLDNYRAELEEMGRSEWIHVPWSYNYFFSGEKILDETRYKYRYHSDWRFKYPNPYELSNRILT